MTNTPEQNVESALKNIKRYYTKHKNKEIELKPDDVCIYLRNENGYNFPAPEQVAFPELVIRGNQMRTDSKSLDHDIGNTLGAYYVNMEGYAFPSHLMIVNQISYSRCFYDGYSVRFGFVMTPQEYKLIMRIHKIDILLNVIPEYTS